MPILPQKVQVVLSSIVTWVTFGTFVLSLVVQQAATLLPEGAAETFASAAGTIALVAAGIVTIIRRVTPVEPEERGLLPANRPGPVDNAPKG